MNRPYAFFLAGEIRFGPPFYRLEIAGRAVPKALFGDARAELQGGRYLAVEEWLSTDYQQGPITRVAIFDLERGLVVHLQRVEKGFVRDFRLEAGVFIYRKYYPAKGAEVEAELDWDSINNWQPYHR